MVGYIYVLTNPSLHGQVKIGSTTRSPLERARELSSTTAVPTPFSVYASWEVSKPKILITEKSIHRNLNKYRTSKAREFFKLEPSTAKAKIDDFLGKLSEQDKQDLYHTKREAQRLQNKKMADAEWERSAAHNKMRAIRYAREKYSKEIQLVKAMPTYTFNGLFRNHARYRAENELARQWRNTCMEYYRRQYGEVYKKYNLPHSQYSSMHESFDLDTDTNIKDSELELKDTYFCSIGGLISKFFDIIPLPLVMLVILLYWIYW